MVTEYTDINNQQEAWEANSGDLLEVEEYKHSDTNSQYVYLLTRKDAPETYTVHFTDENKEDKIFQMTLPAYSAGVAGFEAGKIRAALIKGTNDHEDSNTAPSLIYNDQQLSAIKPCDLQFNKVGSNYKLSVANIIDESNDGTPDDYDTEVTIPVGSYKIDKIKEINSRGEQVGDDISFQMNGINTSFTACDMRKTYNYDELKNIAFGKVAQASTTSDPNQPPMVVTDGDPLSRWTSDNNQEPQPDEAWIYVDLGEEVTFSVIRINWETACGKVYEVQVANADPTNPDNCVTVYTESNGQKGYKLIVLSQPQTARYVKMQGRERINPQWAYSIYEIEVYAAPDDDDWIVGYDIILK